MLTRSSQQLNAVPHQTITTITDNREYDMKLFLLILTSILSIGSISWKDSTDISQNNDCIFRDTLVGYVDYDNVLDSI